MAADVELAAVPKIGIPRELFSLETSGLVDEGRAYDVAPDGQRFMMVQHAGTNEVEPTMMFVENWVSGLAAGD